MKKISFLFFIAGFSLCFALEFGSMGNTPASVGGAGVAYKKNSWAVYYNPALLGVNRKTNIAYSFGVGYEERALAQLANIDYNNIQNIPTTISRLAKGETITAATTRNTSLNVGAARSYADLGVISDVLQNITNGSFTSGITDESSLKGYIDSITGTAGNDLEASLNALKALTGDDRADKFTQIKNDLSGALGKVEADGGNVGIFKDIIDNIDIDKIDGLISSIKDSGASGDFDIGNLLTHLGGITLNRGVNSSIDRILDDYMIINDSMRYNSLKVNSKNGLVFHIPGGDERGAIGFGVLASVHGFMNLKMDERFDRIIIESGNNYYEVEINNSHISLKASDANAYNTSSLLSPNANHSLYANNVALFEVPIAYGHTIPFRAGELHLGAGLKYIHAVSVFSNQVFNLDKISLNFDLKDNVKQTSTFGIDVGGLYTIGGFSLGFVGKNLNAPKIKTADGKLTLNSQFRAGLGFEIWRFTFLADIDLLPNATLEPNKKNQMVGGGVIFDASWVDFRLGAMRDLRANPYGTILTAGMNIVNFIDISVQSSLIMKNISKYRVPNYLDIRVGGRFLF